MPTAELDQRLTHVRASTTRLIDALTALDLPDAAFREPSLLPGWSRAHVLSHIARNADAIRRMVDGASRGESAAMYPGGQAVRDAEIEAGAGRSAAELLADLQGTAERLDEAWGKLPDDAWDIEGITRTGRSTIRRMVPSRWREVEIHAVDLLLGYGPADWPAAFVAPLLPSLVDPDRLSPRLPAGVAVDIEAVDSGQRWTAGTGTPARVSAPSWALTAWLLGRPAAVTDVLRDPPTLTPWL